MITSWPRVAALPPLLLLLLLLMLLLLMMMMMIILEGVMRKKRGAHGGGNDAVQAAARSGFLAALLAGEDLFGVSYDYAKCFDRIPHGILLRLIDELGDPDARDSPGENEE